MISRLLLAIGWLVSFGAAFAARSEAADASAAALPDPIAIRRTLAARDFAALERHFEATRDDERSLRASLYAFQHLLPAQDEALAAWAEQRGDHPPALLALASRELGRAWESRGNASARDTARSRMDLMAVHLARSEALVARVIALDPAWLDAYRLRIHRLQLTGPREQIGQTLQAALAIEASNEGVWRAYLATLSRRWGGSYAEQEAAALEAQKYAGRNPRLRILLGYPDWDRGNDFEGARRSREAIEAYTRALAYFENPAILVDRADARLRARDVAGAAADLERAAELDPYDAETHYLLAHVHVAHVQPEFSVAAAQRAVALAPTKPEFADYLQQCETWRDSQPRAAGRRRPSQGFEAILAWLTNHAFLGLLLALGSWGVHTLWTPLRRGTAGADAGSLSRALLRAYLGFVAVWHTWNSVAHFDPRRWVDVSYDLPVTLIGLLGGIAYASQRRIAAPAFWQVWAWFFPISKVIFQVVFESATLAEWPSWGFVHVLMLPGYLALFQYAYRSEALWAGSTQPPGIRPGSGTAALGR